MPNLLTVATLAALLNIKPRLVQYRAQQLGIEKVSGIYLFTPEQAEAIRQYKTKPGPAPKPESEITCSAKSKRRSRAKKQGA